MKKKQWVLIALTAIIVSAMVVPASVFGAESLLDTIIKRGTIKIGTVLQFPPQMYRDTKGQPAGYDVELMKMLANDMKVKLEVVDMEFDGLIPALLAKKIDMVSCGLVNTPERSLSLEFTDGYVPYRQVVVVPTNSKATAIADLNKKGIKITALLGSTAENIAKRKFPNADVVGFKQQEAMMEVTSGRADAHVAEEYLAMPLVANYPTKVKILNPDEPFSAEWGTYAVRPGDYRFLQYLNNWVRYYRVRGILDAMYADIILPTFFEKKN
jgi:polar amino acid transport system substrate-binding protein